MHFNCKQYKQSLQDTGDMALQNVTVEERCPTVSDIIDIQISNYINIAANDCEYSGSEEELIVNYIRTF